MIRVLVLALVALYSLAGTVMAADLPSRNAPPPAYVPPPPLLTWTGFYAGLNIGGGWSSNSINNNNLTAYTDPVAGGLFLLPGSTNGGSSAGGVVGGGQLGYNYQIGSFVVGAETDIHGTSMSSGGNNNSAAYPSPVTPGGVLVPLAPGGNPGVALNWFGTVRGRAGFLVIPNLLVYGTGGFAYGGVSGGLTGFENTRTGWTAGGGVEWAFLPNWTAKLEYKFVDLDSGGVTGAYTGYNYGYHDHPQFNIVSAGVNYRFNFGGPSYAKY
jgi:outer membrane immunogenic protein